MLYKTKVDIAYDMLMERITEGVYKPGEKLVITHISKELGISDIPVREAIRRLESEGYVKILPNQGAIVYDSTAENLEEMFCIKGVLEGYATRLAMEYLTEADYKNLYEINRKLQSATENNEAKHRGELNIQFHQYIYNACGSSELQRMINEFWMKYKITKMLLTVFPDRSKFSVKEHEDILALMQSGDADGAEMAMRRHALKSGQEAGRSIKET